MDVQPGHCWRCNKILPRHVVHCRFCPVAVYCSTACHDGDKIRHNTVECKTFGAKWCSACGKTGNLNECSQCNTAWYCNMECQRRDWEAHKSSCTEVKKKISALAFLKHKLFKLYADGRTRDFPYYIGNTVATDLLQLDHNELKDDKKEMAERDYHILSAGCGNLRNTVLTAGSLPARFQGKLHITLNDIDPFVMARNVLFLFMLVCFAHIDDIASSLTTIWYSLHITEKEYDLIKTSLDELIQMSAKQLHDVTKGLVNIQNKDLKYIRQVWEKWQSLECQRNKGTSINLKEQRSSLYKGNMSLLSCLLDELSQVEKTRMKEWYDHALFLSTETKDRDIPFDNPTLTGREPCLEAAFDIRSLKNYRFVYCINLDATPFREWDCLRVRESTPTPCSSPMVMYHNYVTNLLQKVKSLILQGRLLIHISLANCLDFPRYHQDLQMPNYDRIFTSNLADYLGFARLLQTCKPLLNASNSFSVIVTETLNWSKFIPEADLYNTQESSNIEKLCIIAYLFDKSKSVHEYKDMRDYRIIDYYDNTPHFLHYLRADIMAGGHRIPPLKDVPSFMNVKKYHGMQMRDFRKGLNKLIPFKYRVNVRPLSMINWKLRAVEWCLSN